MASPIAECQPEMARIVPITPHRGSMPRLRTLYCYSLERGGYKPTPTLHCARCGLARYPALPYHTYPTKLICPSKSPPNKPA